MQLFTVYRTKNRDLRRITEYMRRRDTQRLGAKSLITEIVSLDSEANPLSDRLEEYVKDERKRDFEILLLKGDIEKRKKYPRRDLRRSIFRNGEKERQKRQGTTRNFNGSHGARKKKK